MPRNDHCSFVWHISFFGKCLLSDEKSEDFQVPRAFLLNVCSLNWCDTSGVLTWCTQAWAFLQRRKVTMTWLESFICRLPGVFYIGERCMRDTHCIIAESTALLNSSLSEGMSGAILEVKGQQFQIHDTFPINSTLPLPPVSNKSFLVAQAMALGVPVVVRDIPGNRSLVEHWKTGLLYATPQVL